MGKHSTQQAAATATTKTTKPKSGEKGKGLTKNRDSRVPNAKDLKNPPGAVVKKKAAAALVVNTVDSCCDICWGKDGYKGMKLIKCQDCGIRLHLPCYGMDLKKDATNFTCWACQAVGTTIRVRERDPKTGKLVAIKVTERPTECCLCATDNKQEYLHAMHAMFDDYGLYGRQILLPATKTLPRRLAWAHTLCCMSIGAFPKTKGCVYGCTKSGEYQGDDDEEERHPSDDESVNSQLALDADDSIHHFAYVLRKKNAPENAWTRSIAQQQRLKCIYCGSNDSQRGVYRIPIQCCANDEYEFSEFKGAHPELGYDTCYVAMHVGCAVWRKGEKSKLWPCHRRVYFFPGGEECSPCAEPVSNVFCDVHARDLEVKQVGGFDVQAYPGLPRKRIITNVQRDTTGNKAVRNVRGGPALPEIRKRKLSAAAAATPSAKKLQSVGTAKVGPADTNSSNTETVQRDVNKNSSTVTKAIAVPKANSSLNKVAMEATVKPSKSSFAKSSVQNDASRREISPVTVTKKRKRTGDATKPKSVKVGSERLEMIHRAIMRDFAKKDAGKGHLRASQIESMKETWQTKLPDIPEAKFEKVWSRSVKEYINQTNASKKLKDPPGNSKNLSDPPKITEQVRDISDPVGDSIEPIEDVADPVGDVTDLNKATSEPVSDVTEKTRPVTVLVGANPEHVRLVSEPIKMDSAKVGPVIPQLEAVTEADPEKVGVVPEQVRERRSALPGHDWSYLFVGKNFDPDGLDFLKWDSIVEIPDDCPPTTDN